MQLRQPHDLQEQFLNSAVIPAELSADNRRQLEQDKKDLLLPILLLQSQIRYRKKMAVDSIAAMSLSGVALYAALLFVNNQYQQKLIDFTRMENENGVMSCNELTAFNYDPNFRFRDPQQFLLLQYDVTDFMSTLYCENPNYTDLTKKMFQLAEICEPLLKELCNVSVKYHNLYISSLAVMGPVIAIGLAYLLSACARFKKNDAIDQIPKEKLETILRYASRFDINLEGSSLGDALEKFEQKSKQIDRQLGTDGSKSCLQRLFNKRQDNIPGLPNHPANGLLFRV